MADDRLPTSLWLDAHFRRLTMEGMPYYIIQRGNFASGTILVRIIVPGQVSRLQQQQRDLNGRLGWMPLFQDKIMTEGELDAFILRARDRDPDLWVIEVENRTGNNPFS